jgi:hypothetical protein
VDTNVLVAASAAVPSSRAAAFAAPDDPDLRLRVWNWLSDFDEAESHLVLDITDRIQDEYESNLGFDDFGLQVIIHKLSISRCDFGRALR